MAREISLFVPDEKICLTREGEWLSNGADITHEGTVQAFARALKRDANGYFIQVGRDTKRVEVEDTPYFVRSLAGSAARGFILHLNDGTAEDLDVSTLSFRPGRLSCKVKGGAFDAKFLRAPYNEVLSAVQKDSKGYFVRIGETDVRLQEAP